jgi:Tfp pilus assembly protein PilN
MLRVNLIGQRMAEDQRARFAWLVCLAGSILLIVVTTAVCASGGYGIWTKAQKIRSLNDKIKVAQADADRVSAMKRQVEVLQPIASLASEVQGTAGYWGALLRDVTQSVPDRGGYWLESLETKFDDKTYRQTCTVKGYAQRQELVGELTGRLTQREDSVDPENVNVPGVELQVDDKSGTQKVSFTIEAGLRKAIGVNYQ